MADMANDGVLRNEKKLIGGRKKGRNKGCYRPAITEHPIYGLWKRVRGRCHNPLSPLYRYYGGRGIVIEEPWASDFAAFFADMAPTWVAGLTIERKDNNGNYCKSNCRWATKTEQANNKRDNVLVEHDGQIKTAAQWERETGIRASIIRRRVHRGNQPDNILNPVDGRITIWEVRRNSESRI